MRSDSGMINGKKLEIIAEKWIVYRLYDEDERLLYVGMTGNLYGRLSAHCRRFHEVKWYTAEEYPDWGTARRAEGRAIATENPFYNREGRNPNDADLNRMVVEAFEDLVAAEQKKVAPYA
jgi:predicted GIY-YIG superfamily endonuclease